MELDGKTTPGEHAIPQGSPRRSEYLTFCHEQAAAVKGFRVSGGKTVPAAAAWSID
jgi:hypothetical protein